MTDFASATVALKALGYTDANVEENWLRTSFSMPSRAVPFAEGPQSRGASSWRTSRGISAEQRSTSTSISCASALTSLETDMAGVLRRLRRTFSDRNFVARISHRRSNWMQVDPQEAMNRVVSFLASLPEQ